MATKQDPKSNGTIREDPSKEANARAAPPPAIDDRQKTIPQIAKERLSKWAARLFDPNRPKGLIQPPQIIPLNDEFLTAFGKREKKTDQARGVVLDIDTNIDDVLDDDAVVGSPPPSANTKKKQKASRKIKVSNIKFTTTEQTLETVCEKFGPLERVNLIKDKEDDTRNSGFAYVTFENASSALEALDQLTKLDHRPVTVSLCNMSLSTRNAPTRYFGQKVKDLSTKCFRCGQIGHMAASCPNERAIAPCPLCAQPHSLRDCPNKAVCFNCGVPGHVSRNCNERRGLPPRIICTICYAEGSHCNWQCRQRRQLVVPPSADAAVCMTCGKLGHFSCRPLTFFFGLRGTSCGNCGMFGHTGPSCQRPNAEMCQRNGELVAREVDRAASVPFVEHKMVRLNQQQHQQQGQPNRRGYGNGNNRSPNRNNNNSRKRKQGNR